MTPDLVGLCPRLCGKRHLGSLPCWAGRYVRHMRAETFARWGRVCWLCGIPGADTIDHVTPRSRGGVDNTDNLRPAHRACNIRRGNQTHVPAVVTAEVSDSW